MSFSNFSRLTGADTRSSSYRTYLKNTIKKLADSSFWVDDGAKSSDLYRWISGGTNIDFENKTINMRFSPEIFPYLTQLKSNYLMITARQITDTPMASYFSLQRMNF